MGGCMPTADSRKTKAVQDSAKRTGKDKDSLLTIRDSK